MSKSIFRFRVSDHALLRYMERILGVDVESFRAKLRAHLEPAAEAGAASLTVAGLSFRFSRNSLECAVTTVIRTDVKGGKQTPPASGDDSREYKKIKARKRMK